MTSPSPNHHALCLYRHRGRHGAQFSKNRSEFRSTAWFVEAARNEDEEPARCPRRRREAQPFESDLARQFVAVEPVKGHHSREQLPHHYPETPRIAFVRIFLAEQYLRRNPLQRADTAHCMRLVHLAAEAKVGDLDAGGEQSNGRGIRDARLTKSRGQGGGRGRDPEASEGEGR
jgi:hypothetical protein